MRQSPVKIFISFASSDGRFVKKLEEHLKPLELQGMISLMHINKIPPGADWLQETNRYIDSAQIILALLSPDYLASDFCEREIDLMFRYFETNRTIVIPIFLRPTDWRATRFAMIQGLPLNGKAVTTWSKQDAAFVDIVRGIEEVTRKFLREDFSAIVDFEAINDNEIHKVPKMNDLALGEDTASSAATTNSLESMTTNLNEYKMNQSFVIQGRLEKEAIKKYATADIPIQSLEEDKLGFSVYVGALRDFIASQDTSTPLTVGIHGSWGSGKSSLMRMLQKQLDPNLSFIERWQLVLIRLKWTTLFFISLPFWLSGKSFLWIGDKCGVSSEYWLRQINSGLLYNANLDTLRNASSAPVFLRFWRWVGKWHTPVEPATYPTVWFNAWRFDQEEQLWAALALEVLDQIKRRYSFIHRVIFWVKLSFKRLSLLKLIRLVALPLFFAFLEWIYISYMKQLPNVTMQIFGFHIPLGHLLLGTGIVLSAIIQIIKIAKDPFQIEVKDIFDKPNYKDRVGFIGSFETDFSRIVSLITKPRFGLKAQKLVIFIDDLDRCEASKAADIIEGINLFLDSKGCVFVLGMDIIAVSASIETKYKDVFEKLRDGSPEFISPGRFFLDKIIQVPFNVPPSTEEGMNQLIMAITQSNLVADHYQRAGVVTSRTSVIKDGSQHSKTGPLKMGLTPLSAKSVLPDPASYKLHDVTKAISKGARFLPENPRQLKRFINLFRLYVYIADARNLLRFKESNMDKQSIGLTLDRLAVWVAFSLRWAEIVRSLLEEVQLSQEELRAYLLKISAVVQQEGSWVQDEHRSERSFYEELLKIPENKKQTESNSPSHWCHLAWKRWLLDEDFLRCIKDMESFWQQPQIGQENWLQAMLTMSITFSPNAVIETDTSVSSNK